MRRVRRMASSDGPVKMLSLYQRISGTDTPGRIPATDSIIMISNMMNSTRTICPIGAGSGNIPISHQINPNTIRYTIKLIIKFIFFSPLALKNWIYHLESPADSSPWSYSCTAAISAGNPGAPGVQTTMADAVPAQNKTVKAAAMMRRKDEFFGVADDIANSCCGRTSLK
jgi:hypothetical protein